MDPLQISPAPDTTPAVQLDASSGIFEISGWSLPEDSTKFYTPVLSWLTRYAEQPNPNTVFHFKYQYFNTASAKQILKIISVLETVAHKSNTTVHWHGDKEDEDMLTSGKRFSKLTTVPFEFVSS